jgi:hypothetical protein
VTATNGELQPSLVSVQAGIADDGEALVAWTAPGTEHTALEAVVAAPGGAFGPVQHVAQPPLGTSTSPAEARDGRALLAFWNGKAIAGAERAPGAAFATPAAVAPATGSGRPSTTIGPGGAAVIAWGDTLARTIAAVARAGTGAFGAPVTIAGTALSSAGGLTATLLNVDSRAVGLGSSVFGAGGPDLRTAITPGGSALSQLSLPAAGGATIVIRELQTAETHLRRSSALTFRATLRHAGSAIHTVQVIATCGGEQRTRQVSARVR